MPPPSSEAGTARADAAVIAADAPSTKGSKTRFLRLGLSSLLRGLSFLRRHWSELAFVLLAAGLLYWTTWDAFWIRGVTYSRAADYWEHSAVLRSLLDNPWHPKNPHLVSPASSPRFGPQFILVALLGRALHVDAVGAMGIAAVFNTVLLLIGIFSFFRCYFSERLAPLYGLIVLFCSWWNAWFYSNVTQLQVYFSVDAYPSTHTLGFTFLTWALAVRLLRSPRLRPVALGLLLLCSAYVLIAHQLTAAMSLSGLVILTVTEPGVPWRRRLRVCASVLAGCLLARFWPYFSPWEVLAGGKSSNARWVQDTVESALTGSSSGHLHLFYAHHGLTQALGLSMIAGPVLLYCLIRRRQLFLVLGALSMGIPFVVNAFIPLPLGHRFILLCIVYLQIAVVWLLLSLTPNARQAFRFTSNRVCRVVLPICVAATLYVFAKHNFDLADARLNAQARHARRRESGLLSYSRRISELVAPGSVVLGPPVQAWPVPTFGTKVVSIGHPNPLVPDEDQRVTDTSAFFETGSDRVRTTILRRYHVTHVLVLRTQMRKSLTRFLANRARAIGLPEGLLLFELTPEATQG